MVIYILAVIPLLLNVLETMLTFRDSSVKMTTCTDVAAAESFKHCWDSFCKLGIKFGHYEESARSRWIIKKYSKQKAESSFEDSSVKLTSSRRRHLQAAIGKTSFKVEYFSEKENAWLKVSLNFG